jgi:hypothetical protein
MVEYKDRLICFLDVLGFSKFIQKKELLETFKQFESFIISVKDANLYGDYKNLPLPVPMIVPNFEEFILVSDSIIIISYPIDDPVNVNHFIYAVHSIMSKGFTDGFPLRGSINKGNIIIDKSNNIFLGDSIPQLVRYEHLQKMPVCSILDSAEEIVLESVFGKGSSKKIISRVLDIPIIKCNVPLKEENDSSFSDYRWCVNFTFFLTSEEIQKGLNFLIDDKKYYFSQYLNYLAEIPFRLYGLSEEYLPAMQYKCFQTILGQQVQFLDKDLKPCIPRKNDFQTLYVGRY